MGIVPDMEIHIDVACDEDPLRHEWFCITGLENSCDSLRIIVKRYK